MALDPLPDWFRFIVVPILIGIISSLVGFFLNMLSVKSERERTNRKMQVTKSVEVCTKVINTLDVLYSNFKYNAWYVAWRKALPPTADYVGSELQKADEQQWKDYNMALTALREHQIEYETDLKGYFGATGIESKLFLEIDAVANEVADNLSMIYYSNELGDSSMWLGQGPPKEGLTEKDRLKSREECVHRFAFLHSRIKVLSETMIHCIQVGYVGSFRTGKEPGFGSDQTKELKETELYKKPHAPEATAF